MRNEIRRDGQTLSLANWHTEIRAASNLKLKGVVYANSTSVDMGGFKERVRPYAFSESLKSRNVYALYQHDHTKPLANTKSGTLRVQDKADGVHFEIDLPDTTLGHDIYKLVKSGVLSGTSFAMSNIVESWSRENGEDVRYIESATLHEISPVTWGAYESNFVAARGKSNNQTKELENFFSERKEEMTKAKLKRADDFLTGKASFKNSEDFLQAVIRHYSDPTTDAENMDPRLKRASGLSGQSFTDGYPTPEGFVYDLLNAPTGSEIYRRCSKYPMIDYSKLRLPAVDETTRTSSQHGGAIAYWEDEADSFTDVIPRFRMVAMKLKKLTALGYLTDELLNASLQPYLKDTLSVAAGRKLTSEIINGTGSGRFLGIVNAGCTITVDPEGGQAAGSLVIENIAKMLARLPDESRHSQVCWLIQPALYETMVLQQFAAGDTASPLIRWRSGGEKFDKLGGFDLIPCESCPGAGERGDLILADLTKYLIAQKQAKEDISGHVRFLNDESALRLVIRADGAPSWSVPVTPENSSTTVSPFIVLGARS
jgi:HK97 family phage prohead protease/HK97 family phage major capsid protein